jgi:hypothetical protein
MTAAQNALDLSELYETEEYQPDHRIEVLNLEDETMLNDL